MRPFFSPLLLPAVLAFVSPLVAGTRVDMETSIGTIKLELYDDQKPATTANFLNYINSGSYTNSFAHRLVPGFVFQGGGFTVDNNSLADVPTNAPIINEAPTGMAYSNAYGTIAMARVAGNQNSATSQWFINLADNTSLDTAEGGYAVFGYVVEGLNVLERLNTTFSDADQNSDVVVDASAQLGGVFNSLPLISNTLASGSLIHTNLTVAVPEPGSLLLAVAGAFGLFASRCRSRK